MPGNNARRPEIVLKAVDLMRSIQTGGGRREIIWPFSFEFERGRIYGIVGPSGSGKTSLLRLFNRLDEKSGGELLFHDRPIENYPVTELRKKIALVFQIPHLFPGTVASNLFYCYPERENSGREYVSKNLSLVGLDPELADRDPEKLSVGQKQRVALARSLVQEPEILLLDEPTSALDPGAAKVIEGLILKLNRELSLTIIMVTHDFQQALRLDSVSLLLVDGRLVESGSSKELFTRPATDTTRKFINGELR
jgi:putative ABC transport system ATP-binding protein